VLRLVPRELWVLLRLLLRLVLDLFNPWQRRGLAVLRMLRLGRGLPRRLQLRVLLLGTMYPKLPVFTCGIASAEMSAEYARPSV